MSTQLTETKEITFSDKLHKMADSLRNCQNITQAFSALIQADLKGGFKLCVFGALAFRAGTSYEDILTHRLNYTADIAKLYGVTTEEFRTTFKCSPQAKARMMYSDPKQMEGWDGELNSLWGLATLNDRARMNFREIAEELDYWAGQVK